MVFMENWPGAQPYPLDHYRQHPIQSPKPNWLIRPKQLIILSPFYYILTALAADFP